MQVEQQAPQINTWIEIAKIALPIIGTLGGVAVGGAIAYYSKKFELKHQTERENNKLILSKLEELHASISEYINTCSDFKLKVIGYSPSADAPEKVLSIASDIFSPVFRITSKINLYIPSAALSWSKAVVIIGEFHVLGIESLTEQNSTLLNFNTNYPKQISVKDFNDKFIEAYKHMTAVLQEIEKESRKYTKL